MKKLLFVILSIGLLAKNGWAAGPNDAILDLCGDAATWNPDEHKCVVNPPLVPDHPVPDIQGISRKEAEAIFSRHFKQLSATPGLTGIGLGVDGVDIEVQGAPDLTGVPSSIEGVPVHVRPSKLRMN